MTEAWQPTEEPTVPPDLRTFAGVAAVTAALRELGLMKSGEETVTMHACGCPVLRAPHPDICTCPAGPEIQYADWDEQTPVRHYNLVERFYAQSQ